MVETEQIASAAAESPRAGALLRASRSVAGIRWMAWIDCIGVAYALGIWASLIVMRPDMNPLSHFLSEYVHGPYGMLMASTFVVLGCSWAMLAVGLFRTTIPAGRSWFGLSVLVLGSVLTFGMGIFPTDSAGDVQSMAGTLHGLLAKLFFVSICPGILALTVAWRHDQAWSALVRPGLVLAGIALAGLLFLVTSPPEFTGLAQRITLIGVLGWHMSAAARVGRLS